MAYRVEIEDDFDREPQQDGFGARTVQFVLGYESVGDIGIFMAVRFATAPNNEGVYDLRFGIEERSEEQLDWVVGMDYSIEYSKRYVPPQYRQVVLQYILEGVASIVNTCGPAKVTMQSFHPNLPDKAMVKYAKICELMTSLGYNISINQRDGTTGKHYWLFERIN